VSAMLRVGKRFDPKSLKKGQYNMASMTDTFKVIPVTTESIDTLESALNAASEDGFVWEGALSITDGPALVVMKRGPSATDAGPT
jgi:hypothetical protein